MNGKTRCKILKEIRQKIADENDIPYVTAECTHKGECRGTCPRCEAELRYLEEQLEKRRGMGKRVAVAAVAAGMAVTATGCAPVEELIETLMKPRNPGYEQLVGEVEVMGLIDVERWENDNPPEIVELDGDVAQVIPIDE